MKQLQPKSTQFALTILFLFFFFLLPAQAYAFEAVEDALQKIVDFITGDTGRLLAILAVAGFGIAAFFGRISWRRAGEVVIGIAILFGAASIVDMFAS